MVRCEELVHVHVAYFHKCEESVPNPHFVKIGIKSSYVKNTHVCYAKFDFVRIFHKA